MVDHYKHLFFYIAYENIFPLQDKRDQSIRLLTPKTPYYETVEKFLYCMGT